MKAWLISVVCLTLLTVLLEVLLAEGKTKKFISGLLGVLVTFAMIAPITQIISKLRNERDLSIETVSITESSSEKESVSTLIGNRLREALHNERIESSVDVRATRYCVENVWVFVNKTGINENESNINTIEKIKEVVQKVLRIDKEKIYVVYEQNDEQRQNQ